MTPDSDTSRARDPATRTEIARLGWWVVLLVLRSATDLLEHRGTDRKSK